MSRQTQEGDSIVGEKIVYKCRGCSKTRFIQLTGQHRGLAGSLSKATCIIEKRFRFMPQEEK